MNRLNDDVLDCTCRCELRLAVEELQDFQGGLKELPQDGYDRLKRSMERFGFSFPEFVWRRGDEWMTLDGHQRLRVLRREGWAVDGGVPCVEIEAANEREAKQKLLLAVSAYGKVSPQGLYEFTETSGIPLTEFDLVDLPGVDMEEFLAEFYGQHPGEVPEPRTPPANPVSRAGDLWLLGPHHLLCGDATSADDVGRLLDGQVPFLMVTDPPYGVEYDPAWRTRAASDGHLALAARREGEGTQR